MFSRTAVWVGSLGVDFGDSGQYFAKGLQVHKSTESGQFEQAPSRHGRSGLPVSVYVV